MSLCAIGSGRAAFSSKLLSKRSPCQRVLEGGRAWNELSSPFLLLHQTLLFRLVFPPLFQSSQSWTKCTKAVKTNVETRQLRALHPAECTETLQKGPLDTKTASEGPDDQSFSKEVPHIPVLLNEVLGSFDDTKLSVVVDGTLGAAGHASALLEAHPEVHTFIGLDVDPRAHREAKRRLEGVYSENLKLHLVTSNFGNVLTVLKNLKQGYESGGIDGMLLDLGVSSMQVDEADRGFSFMRDGPLDMRMDPRAATTAEHVVNDWSEDRLAKIIKEYGEERYWKSIACRIAEARTSSRIQSTGDLVAIIGGPRPGRRKGGLAKGIHPATRTFQALRIAVNNELGVLERVLPQAIESLAPGGRLAVISFHSLEDRIVKRAFLAAAGRPYVEEDDEIAYSTSNAFLQKEAPKPVVRIVTRKPVVPSSEEARLNPRSRSSKLRVVEKL